jgi:hypothetical protein
MGRRRAGWEVGHIQMAGAIADGNSRLYGGRVANGSALFLHVFIINSP